MELRLDANCWLRNWEPGDNRVLPKYGADPSVMVNMLDGFPDSWAERSAREPDTLFAVATEEGAIGGLALIIQRDVYRRSAGVGYWLGRMYWGRGIMTRAVGALAEHAFSSLDLVRLFALVYDFNSASMRVVEKNGFKLEGRLRDHVTKQGQTHDSLCYALLRRDYAFARKPNP